MLGVCPGRHLNSYGTYLRTIGDINDMLDRFARRSRVKTAVAVITCGGYIVGYGILTRGQYLFWFKFYQLRNTVNQPAKTVNPCFELMFAFQAFLSCFHYRFNKISISQYTFITFHPFYFMLHGFDSSPPPTLRIKPPPTYSGLTCRVLLLLHGIRIANQ
jgi:hypothetical protein